MSIFGNPIPPSSQHIFLCAGVNQTPGASLLEFAESDAQSIVTLLESERGPGPASVYRGFGAQVTAQSLNATLSKIRDARPRFFGLYFSGHGSEAGIALSDRLFFYNDLVDRMAEVGAEKSILILDVCHAASYQKFLKEAQVRPAGLPRLPWRDQLALAVPGARRMYAASADQNAREASPFGGVFTWALLTALANARGDMAPYFEWVSDRAAFNGAVKILRDTFGSVSQTPEASGLDGTLPLFLGLS